MKFKKMAIIGVGLIGGSIGLAAKKKHIAGEVIGVFRRPSTMKKALKRRAVDSGTLNIKEGVRDADLIILATPVHLIPEMALQAIKYSKTGAIITDAGSTKSWIVEHIEKKLKKCSGKYFVGSHPMAGSEHTSVDFARADLFIGSPCIVTKTQRTDNDAVKKVSDFWKAIGGRVSLMAPEEHDRSVSLISHLPHMVAFGLAGAVPVKELKYAAEGFKDTTRVASSDPELWADIFFTNKKELLRSSGAFSVFYRKLLKALSKGDRPGMIKLLASAKAKRDKLAYGKRS